MFKTHSYLIMSGLHFFDLKSMLSFPANCGESVFSQALRDMQIASSSLGIDAKCISRISQEPQIKDLRRGMV
jgi:hypothetical protein